MDVEKKVVVEPAGKSEGDWSAAPRSSTALPEFVEGEYKHLIDVGGEPAQESGAETEAAPAAPEAEIPAAPPEAFVEESGAEPEDDELVSLDLHMTALLEAGGKERDGGSGASLRSRIAARFPRNQ